MKGIKKQRAILFILGVFFLLSPYSVGISATEDEENNISTYRRIGPGVVNITSVVIERDFFSTLSQGQGLAQAQLLILLVTY
jgi:hypothetical protein